MHAVRLAHACTSEMLPSLVSGSFALCQLTLEAVKCFAPYHSGNITSSPPGPATRASFYNAIFPISLDLFLLAVIIWKKIIPSSICRGMSEVSTAVLLCLLPVPSKSIRVESLRCREARTAQLSGATVRPGDKISDNCLNNPKSKLLYFTLSHGPLKKITHTLLREECT